MPHRRILSLRFPRLVSDRLLRGRGVVLAVIARQGPADRLVCLSAAAQAAGLRRGMTLVDARAMCPDLITRPLDPPADAAFLAALSRWAGRFSPLVGREGGDSPQHGGLVLDVTGVAHLFGGEAALVDEIIARLDRAGIETVAGLADTRGAAFALARCGGGIAAPGQTITALGGLPPAALRLRDDTVAALDRLGLRRIRDLIGLPRATLGQRFGPDLVLRLDQALGRSAEPVSPGAPAPHFGVRITLPEPIGLTRDVEAGLARLLERLCMRLEEAGQGARRLRLWLRRVDGGAITVEIGLARPMRDPRAIAALFVPRLADMDAGFGIDLMRLVASGTERLPARQTSILQGAPKAVGRQAQAGGQAQVQQGDRAAAGRQPALAGLVAVSALHDPLSPAPAEGASGLLRTPAAPPMSLPGGARPAGSRQAAGQTLSRSAADLLAVAPGAAKGWPGKAPLAAEAPRPAPSDAGELSPDALQRPVAAPPRARRFAAPVLAEVIADLVTRLASRLGFEALTRMAPAESHIPERSFLIISAAFEDLHGFFETDASRTGIYQTGGEAAHRPRWSALPGRPITLFPPEPVVSAADCDPVPPSAFRWRACTLNRAAAAGPERIAPEWWFDDPAWRSGLRDYWRVLTSQGPRLWLFHSPAIGDWAAQGEFA